MPAIAATRARPGGPFEPHRLVLLMGGLVWLPLGALFVKLIGL